MGHKKKKHMSHLGLGLDYVVFSCYVWVSPHHPRATDVQIWPGFVCAPEFITKNVLTALT